jgi:hypothetical protein
MHTKAQAMRFCKSIGWTRSNWIAVDCLPLSGTGYLIADVSLSGMYRAPRHDAPAFRHFGWDRRELAPRLVRDVADHLHTASEFFALVINAMQALRSNSSSQRHGGS